MKIDYKKIAEELIPIFEEAGQKSIDLYKKYNISHFFYPVQT